MVLMVHVGGQEVGTDSWPKISIEFARARAGSVESSREFIEVTKWERTRRRGAELYAGWGLAQRAVFMCKENACIVFV